MGGGGGEKEDGLDRTVKDSAEGVGSHTGRPGELHLSLAND